MIPTEEGREREISKSTRTGVTIFIFSGMFGILIVLGGTRPESFFIGLFLLFISFMVVVMYAFWWIATKADSFIGKHLE